MSVRCGNRALHSEITHHANVEAVRACFNGQTGPCGWQYYTNEWSEDGERIIAECDALSWVTARGWQCEDGHEHVTVEVRAAECWDYAADPQEAGLLAGRGVRPVAMNGGSIEIDVEAMRYSMSA